MISLRWKQDDDKLEIFLPSGEYISIACSCVVRNLTNQWRKKNEVVKTSPKPGHPYNPDIFPTGVWKINKPIKKKDKYMAPYFIPTDAWQYVHVWELDSAGNYDHKTHTTIKDRGYGLHYSESNTTLGCIKIENKNDLLFLINIINAELDNNELCSLEVIEQ